MVVHHDVPRDLGGTGRPNPPGEWREFAETVGTILGAIAVFLGLFILFGGENQYLGITGDLSWRVGDISSAWGYGLLAGGLVALAGVLGSVVQRRRGR